MLGQFNSFKILNSVGSSMELNTEELKKKGSSYKQKRCAKMFLDAGLNVIGKKKIKDRLTGLGLTLVNNEIKDIIKVDP